ncbi:aminoglycoside phosphotransferase family protein [Pseudarthrobacter chlorophenolicus]|uniref:aminoglycoside phosphotransferase family protein n=1 Tax=Pseudarthrobacter chlorophenolicus TaxID=85085 RepID=UPI0008891FC7|nr:aminoglycoside phosphotransferase family protein [Pseudarthrobacter chlorophenolicus]SDQ99726.1 streptomycin 6-kinase [Pseudarthrobacter chlorophenolicus]
MTPATSVPIPPGLDARYRRSRSGRAWLASLPGLVAGRMEQWNLAPALLPGALPWSGHGAVVVPVLTEDGTRAALKVAYPHDEALGEPHALALWAGRGAVGLLEQDGPTCSMLLERLEADDSLADVPLDEAAAVWGGLVRQLSLVPDARPEWSSFEHIAARAEQWSDEFPADWNQLGRPFPRWLLEAALEVCQTRGAVGRRSAHDVLVHADLHFLNILARPGTGRDGNTEPAGRYVAIDPQPLIGEAEFAVAPLLWNRLGDLAADGPEAALRRRCADFSAAAGLDPEVARQWAVAREVANALGYAANPRHRGDLARSLWVASTLAGRTLPGLPPARSLPEPGHGSGSGALP